MRIALSIHHHLDWNTGAPGSTLYLKREYEARGHEVDLLAFDALASFVSERFKQVLFPYYLAGRLGRKRAARRFDVIDASTGDLWLWGSLCRRGSRPLI